jgi:hypothetical protein
MAIQGLVRFRRNQIGKQSVIGTAVAATRRVPWRGAIEVNPNRTDPDVDVGSLDPVQSPYPTAREVSWNPTGPLAYNDLPIRLSAGLKGGVTAVGAGTSKSWTFTVASLTADDFDYFTDQFADDTEATDAIIGFGGVADTLEESMPEDLGPWTISDSWVFAGGTMGGNATDSLTVDASPVWVFGADTEIKMDPTAAAIGTTKLTDALHSAVLRVSNNLDQKRYANGSNTRFQLAGYGRGGRVIELVLTFAKTSAVITEANTLDDDPTPNRYFEVLTTSPTLAEAAIPYSYSRRMPGRLFSRAEGEMGGNATIILTYRAFYDATTTYAYKAVVVNTQATVAAA